jgi:hypothetical protein
MVAIARVNGVVVGLTTIATAISWVHPCTPTTFVLDLLVIVNSGAGNYCKRKYEYYNWRIACRSRTILMSITNPPFPGGLPLLQNRQRGSDHSWRIVTADFFRDEAFTKKLRDPAFNFTLESCPISQRPILLTSYRHPVEIIYVHWHKNPKGPTELVDGSLYAGGTRPVYVYSTDFNGLTTLLNISV